MFSLIDITNQLKIKLFLFLNIHGVMYVIHLLTALPAGLFQATCPCDECCSEFHRSYLEGGQVHQQSSRSLDIYFSINMRNTTSPLATSGGVGRVEIQRDGASPWLPGCTP